MNRKPGGVFQDGGLSAGMMTAVLVLGPGLAGCATAPPVPPDPELRELVTGCINRALNHPFLPEVRAQAMEAAADVLGQKARLHIREGLKDEQPGVRFAACMGLGKVKETASIEVIRPLVNDPDPSVRVGAYFALERMGDWSHREAWAWALRDHEDPVVRRNAALALGHLENKSVMPLLRAAANADRDDGVRLQALEALALLGDQEAINQFVRDAFGGLGFKQPFALLTLGRVAEPRVLSALRGRLESAPYPEARLAAARGLAMQGYGDGYKLAVQCLNWNQPNEQLPDDPRENQIMRVQSMAALALGEIGDRRALGWLKQRMESSDDPRVQLAGATAILMILNKASSAELVRR